MKQFWKNHRDNVVAACAIVSTLVAIIGLNLRWAEFKEKSQHKILIQTEIQQK